MAWIELNWVVSRREIERCSVQLFALNAGVQEDFLPGARPAPRQPWDTGPAPVTRTGTAQGPVAAGRCRAGSSAGPPENAQWHSLAPADWGESWKQHFTRHVISESWWFRLLGCPSLGMW